MNHADREPEWDFPGCRALLDPKAWRAVTSTCRADETPDRFLEEVRIRGRRIGAPGFLPELARLEWYVRKVHEEELALPDDPDETILNPSLHLLELRWKNLASFRSFATAPPPEPGDEFVMIWKDPADGELRRQTAAAEDLLVLKMIAEGIDCKEVAMTGGIPVGTVDAALARAAGKGIILLPASRIRRNPGRTGGSPCAVKPFLTASAFTLQWHITQACDLRCRHCYDRTDRSAPTLAQAVTILDDLADFCRKKRVKGQVSFSGGNPLLHPDFLRIYRAAADHGFTLAVLGNPAPRRQLEELISIQSPDFFQVSLEGLPGYNDFIRGEGHFDRTLAFLDLLGDLGIYSMVMLTLTKDNIREVLPLGERLRGRANVLHFNRLAKVGEGATLELPAKEAYRVFLDTYLDASRENPLLGLKDNLLGIPMRRMGLAPFGGCTGFGCGAAFNFLALLSDGEVHACRKFPSPLGNVFSQSLEEIYDSELARRYRAGCAECWSCSLGPVCGGCLACSYSHGLDIFARKDPYCFFSDRSSNSRRALIID